MIEEQFVSFDTAKLLKEAGFDCNCHKWYEQKDDKVLEWEADASCNWNINKNDFSRPTQALAARWLREGHHIFIMLTPVIQGWMYDLFDLKKHSYILCNQDTFADSYEASFETAIREAIKLIKK